MGDYTTNYFKGFINAIVITAAIGVLFWILMPVWNVFSIGYFQALVPLMQVYPPLSGAYSLMKNLTASINIAFFLLFVFIITYILILPFMKEVQEEPYGGFYR